VAAVSERPLRSALIVGAVLAPLVLLCLAYFWPGYFTDELYLGGLILLEFLIAAVWMYRQVFLPLVLIGFLLAGLKLPVGSHWTQVRWVFLGVGAAVGCILMLKDRRLHVSLFHAFALFAVIAALTSSAVSRYPGFALLKALSLFLVFIYGATGARLAVAGRENRFFGGLLTGTELFIGAIATFHLIGVEVMGNPNSLGAVTGVVGAPLLLWGTFVAEKSLVRYRRLALFMICLYLILYSHARAGMAAAFVSCALLCLALRKYRLLAEGVSVILVLVATTAIFMPEAFSNTVSSVTVSVLYKSKDPALGLLASREEPWQAALDSIHEHFWFGTGFGTTDTGQDASEHLSLFASNQDVTAENGSSYLTILTWVGMFGLAPFLLTVLALLSKVVRTLVWTWGTGNAAHPAIPLAMVTIAGLVHASFEDWLFAPGYYLCVFFWCVAFILVDVTPAVTLPQFAFSRQRRPIPRGMDGIPVSR
jgi:O-antigen ligase